MTGASRPIRVPTHHPSGLDGLFNNSGSIFDLLEALEGANRGNDAPVRP